MSSLFDHHVEVILCVVVIEKSVDCFIGIEGYDIWVVLLGIDSQERLFNRETFFIDSSDETEKPGVEEHGVSDSGVFLLTGSKSSTASKSVTTHHNF